MLGGDNDGERDNAARMVGSRCGNAGLPGKTS
jgi:hypothetical protein